MDPHGSDLSLVTSTTVLHSRFSLDADLDSLALWAKVPSSTLQRAAWTSHQAAGLHPVLRCNNTGHREICWIREARTSSYAYDIKEWEGRAETHADRVACRSCFQDACCHRRCVIPATSLHVVRQLGTAIEQPLTLALESGAVFGIAGVWNTWNDKGLLIEEVATIATLVDPLLRDLLGRLPFVLEGSVEFSQWLASEGRPGRPVDLLKPMSCAAWLHWKMVPGPVEMHLG